VDVVDDAADVVDAIDVDLEAVELTEYSATLFGDAAPTRARRRS